ncbi:SDR family NAD(P)-dependent oxidoreductase [Microbacterium sp. EST19A]|uniref:SDR family NAD(P)-dependent oxidoreductase n=1 Tax=Microbacterium sp. EST19A TaxID=2862681 RepID=UPI001CBFE46C|nr:SDR family oxidoreductase [Microbacterium sp. EST19A]
MPDRIVITGAGAGIGRATARRFAADGHQVAVLDRDADRVREVLASLHGEGHLAVPVDLADAAAVEHAFSSIDEAWGGLDVLVNNAARYDHRGEVGELTDDQWDDVLQVNVLGVVRCTRQAVERMPRGGAIINLTALQRERPIAGWAAYAASKAAVATLTRSMAIDYAARGIRVNAVEPGAIAAWVSPDTAPPGTSLLDRFGAPEEVAAVIAFLASPSASFIVGEIIRCDGGRSILPRSDPQTQTASALEP